MSRILMACVFCALLASAPHATRAAENELKTGFSLGRYSTTAVHVAMDLAYIQDLIDKVHPAEITDEALAAGTVTDNDAQMALRAAAYVIWRIQFYIEPMLESAHSSESFEDPVLADLKPPTLSLMDELKQASDAFLHDPAATEPSLAGLAAFGEALKQGDFVTKLLALAEQAAQKAGVSVAK